VVLPEIPAVIDLRDDVHGPQRLIGGGPGIVLSIGALGESHDDLTLTPTRLTSGLKRNDALKPCLMS
jgi:hypothetical protein